MPRKKGECRLSSESTPPLSKATRKKETVNACINVHGGAVMEKEPGLWGMLYTLSSQFITKTLGKKILNTKGYSIGNIKKIIR